MHQLKPRFGATLLNRALPRICATRAGNLSKTSRLVLSLLCVLALPVVAKPRTPAKGSKERAAIMNAVRPQLGNPRHKPIITASTLNVERGWALLDGYWEYADGTPPGKDYDNGVGTSFEALLHLERGRWRVKRLIYAGDVQGPEFMEAFPQAPHDLFFNAKGETL